MVGRTLSRLNRRLVPKTLNELETLPSAKHLILDQKLNDGNYQADYERAVELALQHHPCCLLTLLSGTDTICLTALAS